MSNVDKKNDDDNKLEKRYRSYELGYISFLTIVIIISWALSRDIVRNVIDRHFFMNNGYFYLLTVVGVSIILAAIIMKIIRKCLFVVFRKIIDEKRKNKES